MLLASLYFCDLSDQFKFEKYLELGIEFEPVKR